MIQSKYTDRLCAIITILTLVVTLLFMNGEQFGLVKAQSDTTADLSGAFSDRDLDSSWSESTAVRINLDELEGLTDSGAYELDGDLYLIAKGTYVLSGNLTDHQIIVDAKGAKLQIVLDGVTVENENLPGIYVKRADKVFLTLAENSENVLQVNTLDTETEDVPDAAIYSKSDLSINGSGRLQISSGGHGIKTTDDLVITGGNLEADAEGHALIGKDSVRICGGELTLTAGRDGVKASNDTEEEKGYVLITGGSLTIRSGNDGIQGETRVTIQGGTFDIVTNGGTQNAEAHQEEFGQMGMDGGGGFGQRRDMAEDSDSEDGTGKSEWQPGGMPDMSEMPEISGMPQPGGMPDMGEMPEISGMPQPGEMPDRALTETETTADENTGSDSHKGIKAGKQIQISEGTIVLDCSDDGIHSDEEVMISGGDLQVSSGDDGIHGDQLVTIAGGTINITQSYEGIEGKTIELLDGDVEVTSSDDGLNAGDGSGEDMFGGFGQRGGGNRMFGGNKSEDSGETERKSETDMTAGAEITDEAEMAADTGTNPETEMAADIELALLHISGGTLHVHADGDGLDSNGNLVIDGGNIIVDGPTNSGNGALDSGTESGGDCIVNGGTVIALGASGMAETFSENSTQVSFSVTFEETYQEGDELTILNSEGTELFAYTIQKSGNSVVFSSPELEVGETITVTAGDQTTEITLDSISGGNGYNGFGRMQNR